jgi:hypothetical protein
VAILRRQRERCGGVVHSAMRAPGDLMQLRQLRHLFTREESRVTANYGDSCVSKPWSKQVPAMAPGTPPSGKKLLCISITGADVFDAYSAQSGSLGFG